MELNLLIQALNVTDYGLFAYNEKGVVLEANSKIADSLGYTTKELRQKTIFEINPNYSLISWRKTWKELGTAGVVQKDSEYINAEGKIFPVRIRLVQLELANRTIAISLVQNKLESDRELELLNLAAKINKLGSWN